MPDTVIVESASTARKNNAVYKGLAVYSHVFILKKQYDIDAVEDHMRKLMQTLEEKLQLESKLIQIGFRVQPANTWVSSKWFDVQDETKMPSMEHYNADEAHGFKKVDVVVVNVVKEPGVSSAGGRDPHNDCLYNAIKRGLGEVGLKVLPKCPKTFKTWLQIERDAMIDVSQISVLEDKLKTRIRVVGDFEYESDKPYARTVTVKLFNSHFEYRCNEQVFRTLYRRNAQTLEYALYELHPGYILTYDGKNLEKHKGADERMLREARKHNLVYKLNRNGDIQSNYHDYMQQIAELKEATGGKVDIAKHGYSIKTTALNLFYTISGKAFEFDSMDEQEMKWLRRTKCCGLMYAEPHTAHMREYDVNSHYPSILSSTFTFPMGKPEYGTWTAEKFASSVYYPAGIYRVRIENIDKRLMTVNPENYYTHVDVKRAKDLGYTMHIIEDGQPNVALYKRRISGSQLFAPYMQYLHTFKTKERPLVKQLLNILWGALCQKEYTYDDSDTVEIDVELERVQIFLNSDLTRQIVKTERAYKLPNARIGVFLTAQGRSIISQHIEPVKDEVYRVHTDGFYTTATVATKKKGLGQLELKQEGMFEVRRINPAPRKIVEN